MSIIELTIVAKEARSNMDASSDLTTITNIDPAKEASTEEERISYAVERIVGDESPPTSTYYTVQW